MRALSLSACVLCVLSTSNVVFAQVATPPPAAAAGKDEPGKVAEARAHYERGLALFEEGSYDAARVEFERAYETSPSYRILYNLALVLEQAQDYAGALTRFKLYLEQGGSDVPSDRAAAVKTKIENLTGRVGSVTVSSTTTGATVTVDDVVVGTVPMNHSIVVNPGRRRFAVTASGRLPAQKALDVAPRDKVTITLDPEKPAVVMVDRPSRRIPWVGWGATAGLALGAGTFGILALTQHNKFEDKQNVQGISRSDLDGFGHRANAFSIVSDVLTAGAVVAGVVSLYYTIKWNKEYNRELEQHGPTARFTGNGVVGTF